LVSISIEALQLATGILSKITFRITDVNDVIFNTIGVAIGYILFAGVVNICRRMFQKSNNAILKYINTL
jgi:glycopeptide antibiotics resistance protein